MAAPPLTRSGAVDGGADALVPNRWVHAFAGACLACVGLAFFFLDRSYGDFATVAPPWVVATLLGFASGAIALRRDGPFARAMCALLGFVALALAIFPTFLIYSLLRWAALCMLFVSIARAPLLRTRRDLYFTLTTCFVAATVVAIHSRADWLLWVYLGPACLFAGLALTMEHVASHAVGIVTKFAASVSFIAAVFALASLLFLWLPRPPMLGFGFLPPPAEEPALAKRPGGAQGQDSRGDATGQNSPGSPDPTGRGDRPWHDMLDRMERDLQDPTVPGWQRALLGRLVDAAQGLLRALEPSAGPGHGARGHSSQDGGSRLLALVRVVVRISLASLLAWLAALALLALAWWQRHRLAFMALNAAAWSTTVAHPLSSMKLCARMMAVGLHRLGSPQRPAQPLREQLARTPDLAVMERFRFGEAVDLYYAVRFGRLAATPELARSMRLSVLITTDVALAAAARSNSHRATFNRL